MSLNKPPSFVGINQKDGTYTVAFLTAWYDVNRCENCACFKTRTEIEERRVIAYCERMEAEEPCEITGIRYEGEKK